MNSAIDDHISVLENRVFEINTKTPHFRLLIKDLRELAQSLPNDSVIVSMERNLLYGGYSLIAPIFEEQEFIAVDCSPESADERGAYNSSLIDDPAFIRVKTGRRAPVDDTGIAADTADVVLIPNLVHHIADQTAMFEEARRILKSGGRLYVFEPLVRELHQIPDDFLRYTPYGLASVLEDMGFTTQEPVLEGGPFSVVAYCWNQALQYFPEEQREARVAQFNEQMFPELMELDEKYPDNLVRKHTKFPMAFSLYAQKTDQGA